MYECSTKAKKTREKLVFAAFMILGGISFGFSLLPSVLYPSLYQMAAVLSFTFGVLVLIRYLMRDYVFTVAPREGDRSENGLPDLTVTEIYGKKHQAVCRISLGDIRGIDEITPENRSMIREKKKKQRVYVYTGEMMPPKLYLLEIGDGEDVFFLQIAADEGFLSALRNFGEQ